MAAIYFDPEGYSLSGPRLMGRQAAGHSFLRGFLRHSTSEKIYAYTPKPEDRTAFHAFAKAENVEKPISSMSHDSIGRLSEIGRLFLPGPGLQEFARKRSLLDPRAFSLCGITHTTLSARAMDAIAENLTSPIEPWDAIICTSRSVHDTIKIVLEAEAEYLKHRLGASRFVLPKFPVIPLGINTDEFSRSPNDRDQARSLLQIGSDEIVIIYMGRLSFHAKAHPAAMYRAIEMAREKQKLVLIECGWFANQAIEQTFNECARYLAPNVRRIVMDGRDPIQKKLGWTAADIFMSLTDNLQETFGLTPVEAMAAGLPVIITDWDGYRDTARHGTDGFRIPTYMPRSGVASNRIIPYALGQIDYDNYCGETAHLVAVDIDATTKALHALITNPDLRHSMGREGRARAQSAFDWKRIIPVYENLWRELDEERRAPCDLFVKPKGFEPWPARIDPLKSFQTYPTKLIDEQTTIQLVSKNADLAIKNELKLNIFTLGNRMIGESARIDQVLMHLSTESPITLHELADASSLYLDDIIPIVMFGLKIGAFTIGTKIIDLDNLGAH